VTIEDGHRFCVSAFRGRAKEAEIEAARIAFQAFQKKEGETVLREEVMIFPFELIVLVDMENVPSAIPRLASMRTRNMVVFGFCSSAATQARKSKNHAIADSDTRFTIHEVPSSRMHAAEMGLVLWTGEFLGSMHWKEGDEVCIVIVSGDRFADAAADCLNARPQVRSARVCHHCSDIPVVIGALANEMSMIARSKFSRFICNSCGLQYPIDEKHVCEKE